MMQTQDTMGAFRPLRDGARPATSIVVHAEQGWYEHILSGGCDFFEKIGNAARAHGLDAVLVPAEDVLSLALLAGDHTHIMMGPKRHRGARIFHAQPSYVPGFWYLDTKGYYWNSSLADRNFAPDQIDAATARYFFNGVSGHMIRNNISKRPQEAREPDRLETADAAFFVQNIKAYRKRSHFIKTDKIIDHLARAAEGTVYVKLHPLLDDKSRHRITEKCAERPNTKIVSASVHDIIAKSRVVVSQNSAVGFEALLHKKPVLTCAKSDYHHATLVCRHGKDLREALRTAPDRLAGFPFEKYVYWFLGLQMLEPQKDDFEDRAMRLLLGSS